MKSKCLSRASMVCAAAAAVLFAFAFAFVVEPTIEYVVPGTVTVIILWGLS